MQAAHLLVLHQDLALVDRCQSGGQRRRAEGDSGAAEGGAQVDETFKLANAYITERAGGWSVWTSLHGGRRN